MASLKFIEVWRGRVHVHESDSDGSAGRLVAVITIGTTGPDIKWRDAESSARHAARVEAWARGWWSR